MGTLFAGQEDCDFQSYGGGLGVITTAGAFQSGFARCALSNANSPLAWYRAVNVFTSSSFWFTARVWADGAANTAGILLRITDSSGLPRIQIRNIGPAGSVPITGPYVVEKLDSTGAATQLGSSFTLPVVNSILFKLDVNVVYSATGTFTVYLSNGAGFTPEAVFNYSGDVTTNSLTAVNGIDLGAANHNTVPGVGTTAWSTVIVHTQSTLAMNLAYGAPVANGNANTFTSFAASNVNTVTMSSASPDSSTTAGQLDQYTVNGVPAGNYTVRSVVVSGTAGMGTTGPAHIEWGVRTGATNYWGSSIALNALSAPLPSQTIWDTNPNTLSGWLPAQIGSATGFNIGVQTLV